MYKFDTVKYISKFLVGGGLIYALDKYENYTNSYCLKDAGSFGLSLVLTDVVSDVLENFWNMNNNNTLLGIIQKPIINGILYMYLYDYIIKTEYDNSKENYNILLMGIGGNLLTHYLENPILSLFGYNSSL